MRKQPNSAFSARGNTDYPTRDHIDAALFGSPRAALNELELSAWRFLAAHRVNGLKVTHVAFIDGGDRPKDCARMNTPSVGSNYESAWGATFGEAAIKLALALGMPCEFERKSQGPATPSPGTPSDDAGGSSSAPTASRRNGAKPTNSQRTRSLETVSTTGATFAEAPIDASRSEDGLSAQTMAVKLDLIRSWCGDQAMQARRYGRIVDAREWRELANRVERLI